MKKILAILIALLLSFNLVGCGFLEALGTTNEKVTTSNVNKTTTKESGVTTTKREVTTTERTTIPGIELLETPVISCDELGNATWNAISNAVGYEYYINEEEFETVDVITVTLNNHDTLRVIALGDNVNYQNSNSSSVFKFVNSKLEKPVITDNKGTFTWEAVPGASAYEYYIKRGGVDTERIIVDEPTLVRLKPQGDKLYVKAICDFDRSLDSEYSEKELMLYLSNITAEAESNGYCTWNEIPYASFYYVTIDGVQLEDRIQDTKIRVDSGSKVSVVAVYAYTYYELTTLTRSSNEVTINWTPDYTSKLSTPVLSIDNEGIVSFTKDENTKGFNYKYGLTGEVQFTYANEIKIPKYESEGLYVQAVEFNGGGISSDYSNPVYYIVLPTPALRAYDNKVTWEPIKGAESYDCLVNGVLTNQTGTTLNVNSGDKVMVKAKGSRYLDSYYSTEKTVSYNTYEIKSYASMAMYSSDYYYSQLTSSEKALYDLIDQEAYKVYSGEKTIDNSLEFTKINYSSMGINNSSVERVFIAYRNEHNLYFWIDGSYSYGSYLVLRVNEEFKEESFRREIEKYLFELLDNMESLTRNASNGLKKAEIVHDEILKAMFYSYDEYGNPSDTPNAHSTVGYVLEGKGVCECYARTFELVMNYLGVETIYVTGNAYSGGAFSGHAWNMIKIDGNYYWCDLTWDDDQCNFSNLYDFFMVLGTDVIRGYRFQDTHREDNTFNLPTVNSER